MATSLALPPPPFPRRCTKLQREGPAIKHSAGETTIPRPYGSAGTRTSMTASCAGQRSRMATDAQPLTRQQVAYFVARSLDRVISVNDYPLPAANHSNLRHRPMGIGVQGLADVFAMLDLPFESQGARELNKDIFETIYFGALQASCDMAARLGPYSSYHGSPASLGLLQFDLWGVRPSDRCAPARACDEECSRLHAVAVARVLVTVHETTRASYRASRMLWRPAYGAL